MPPRRGTRTALLWVNYPNNPTGAIAPLAFYERLAALAREHDFVLASDEAYTELWFDEPPVSALQLDDWTNLVVFNTLSKRSSMTGYRSGFVAGDPELIAALKQFRPNVGHGTAGVRPARLGRRLGRRGARRARPRARTPRSGELFLELFERVGLRDAGGPRRCTSGSRRPQGETSEAFATRLLDHGVVVAPGSFLGPSGEGYVRFALVPTIDECRARRRDPRACALTPSRSRGCVGSARIASMELQQQIEAMWESGELDAAAIEEAIAPARCRRDPRRRARPTTAGS